MEPTVPIQLIPLLEKFIQIGRTRYNGRIYDNVLNIFDDLSTDEQRELLRGTLNIYAILTTSFSNVRELIDEGDQSALLFHLKRLKGEATVKGEVEESEDDESNEPFAGDKTFIRSVLFLLGGCILFICVVIFKDAISGDPESMARARFLLNIFSLFSGT